MQLVNRDMSEARGEVQPVRRAGGIKECRPTHLGRTLEISKSHPVRKVLRNKFRALTVLAHASGPGAINLDLRLISVLPGGVRCSFRMPGCSRDHGPALPALLSSMIRFQ